MIKTQGSTSIIETFNIIYSCLCHVKDLKPETIDEILNTLIKGLVMLENDLKKVLNDKLTNEVRVKHLNTLKMFTYLTIEFTNCLEKKQANAKDGDFLASSAGKVNTFSFFEIFKYTFNYNFVYFNRKRRPLVKKMLQASTCPFRRARA